MNVTFALGKQRYSLGLLTFIHDNVNSQNDSSMQFLLLRVPDSRYWLTNITVSMDLYTLHIDINMYTYLIYNVHCLFNECRTHTKEGHTQQNCMPVDRQFMLQLIIMFLLLVVADKTSFLMLC